MNNPLKKLGLSLALARRSKGLEAQGKIMRLRQQIAWHMASNMKGCLSSGKGNRSQRRIQKLNILTVADILR